MIHRVMTVYDAKAEAYLTPFFVPTVGIAMRSFEDTCFDEKHPFNQHPGDYTLYRLGDFDDSAAKFELLQVPEEILNARQVLQTKGDET